MQYRALHQRAAEGHCHLGRTLIMTYFMNYVKMANNLDIRRYTTWMEIVLDISEHHVLPPVEADSCGSSISNDIVMS